MKASSILVAAVVALGASSALAQAPRQETTFEPNPLVTSASADPVPDIDLRFNRTEPSSAEFVPPIEMRWNPLEEADARIPLIDLGLNLDGHRG